MYLVVHPCCRRSALVGGCSEVLLCCQLSALYQSNPSLLPRSVLVANCLPLMPLVYPCRWRSAHVEGRSALVAGSPPLLPVVCPCCRQSAFAAAFVARGVPLWLGVSSCYQRSAFVAGFVAGSLSLLPQTCICCQSVPLLPAVCLCCSLCCQRCASLSGGAFVAGGVPLLLFTIS